MTGPARSLDASGVYTSHDHDGNPVVMKKVSLLIKEFLQQYPPTAGWQVLHEVRSMQDVSPHFSNAIKDGYGVEGLEGVSPGNFLVFESKLLSPNGVVVCNGKAMVAIKSSADFSAGETAGFRRLIKNLGFDGQAADADEARTMASMGIPRNEGSPVGNSAPPVVSAGLPPASDVDAEREETRQASVETQRADTEQAAAENESSTDAQSDVDESDAPPEPTPDSEPASKPKAARRARQGKATKASPDDPPSDATMSQLRISAKMAKVEMPAVKTEGEAKAAIRNLSKPKGAAK